MSEVYGDGPRVAPIAKLPPLVPPLRYMLVEEGVYRSAYPSLINLRFLKRLGLRSMVSLLPEAPVPHLTSWCEANGVKHHFERVPVFKEEVTITPERIAELLQLLVLPERQPVLVHCLDGVSVTGTLIMCLRKLQRWTLPPLLAEYARFARGGDEVPTPPPEHMHSFVAAFKPELEFARLLPEKLPPWLEAVLQLPPPPDERRGGGRGEDWAAATVGRGDERDARHAAQPGRPPRHDFDFEGGGRADLEGIFAREANPRSAEPEPVQTVSSNLVALALEGLTMGPKSDRHRALPTREGRVGQDIASSLGVSPRRQESRDRLSEYAGRLEPGEAAMGAGAIRPDMGGTPRLKLGRGRGRAPVEEEGEQAEEWEATPSTPPRPRGSKPQSGSGSPRAKR